MDSDVSSDEETEDDGISTADIEEGTEALAMQFYKIELAEQKRLMGVMEHHSKESAPPPPDTVESIKRKGKGKGKKDKRRATTEPLEFPFSITAGVEKGAKNRYACISIALWHFDADANSLADTVIYGLLNMPESVCTNVVVARVLDHPKTIM